MASCTTLRKYHKRNPSITLDTLVSNRSLWGRLDKGGTLKLCFTKANLLSRTLSSDGPIYLHHVLILDCDHASEK